MDDTLEATQQKEKLLKTVYMLQMKSDTTLQKASPLLSGPHGMGMVTEHQVHQLAEKAQVICHDLDNIRNLLHYRENDLVQQIPNPNNCCYGGPSGIHCSLDGSLYMTSENTPCVHILTGSGQALQSLPCVGLGRESKSFLPEDVTVTRAGMVAVTDMTNGIIHLFNHRSTLSRGEWIKLGKVDSPHGIGVDSTGRILVADYTQGKVHSFALDCTFKMQRLRSVSSLRGPRYVCSAPDGGFVVSEECGDVQLFNNNHQLVGSLGIRYRHQFGNPAGVCADAEGNIVVADEQHRAVYLFPKSGSPICLVSKGLRKPAGVACSTSGLLFVADTGDNCVKVFKYRVRPLYRASNPGVARDSQNPMPR